MNEMSDKERDAYEAAGQSSPAMTVADVERIAASNKSYTGAAVLTFLLYWLFWLPGFIVNIIYYNEAKRTAAVAGHSLPGMGCLSIMLILAVVSVVLSACGAFFGLFMFF